MIMKHILVFLLMLSAPCLAQVPMTGAGKSAGGAPPPTYTGLGDLAGLTSPVAYWGTDGVTNAYSGNALNVCDAAGANCGDFTVTNGQLNVSTRGSTDCHGGTCVVAKIYDQTAGNNCTGTCDWVQSNNLYRATLTFNCPKTGLWCLTFSSTPTAGPHYYSYTVGGNMSVSSPFTITGAANSTYIGGATGGASTVYYDGSFIQAGYNRGPASANAFMYEGSAVPTVSVSNGAFHSLSWLFNNASSNIVVDGTANTVNTASSSGITNTAFLGATDATGTGQPFAGTFCNLAIYSFGITTGASSEATAISTNQQSFACGGGF